MEDPGGEVILTDNLIASIEDLSHFSAMIEGRDRFIVEGDETEGIFHIEWKQSG